MVGLLPSAWFVVRMVGLLAHTRYLPGRKPRSSSCAECYSANRRAGPPGVRSGRVLTRLAAAGTDSVEMRRVDVARADEL